MSKASDVFVAYKRSPLAFERNGNGRDLQATLATGGSSSLIAEIVPPLGAVMVASAIDRDERDYVAQHPGEIEVQAASGKPFRVQLVAHDEAVAETTQSYFFPEMMWPATQDLWEKWSAPMADGQTTMAWEYYNEFVGDYARTLVDLSSTSTAPVFIVQDYQLAGLPGLLRDARPDSRIGWFDHCAWAGPDSWRVLPGEIGRSILESLCQADWLGFLYSKWALNFLACVDEFVPGAAIDYAARTITIDGHRCEVGVELIGYSPDGIAKLDLTLPRTIEEWVGDDRLVVTYGRTNPNKNIARSIEGFRRAALADPGLRDVKLLVRLSPHNLHVDMCRRAYDDVMARVEDVRRSLGEDAVMVVEENDMAATLASYTRADVLIFNPLIDGQNTSVMESIMVNERGAGVIVSEMVGVVEAIGGTIDVVNPYDVDAEAQAIRRILNLSYEDRMLEAKERRRQTEGLTLPCWVDTQCRALGIPLPDRTS